MSVFAPITAVKYEPASASEYGAGDQIFDAVEKILGFKIRNLSIKECPGVGEIQTAIQVYETMAKNCTQDCKKCKSQNSKMKKLIAKVQTFFQKAQARIDIIINKIKGWINTAMNAIAKAINWVVAQINAIIKWVIDMITAIIQSIINMINAAIQWVIDQIKKGIEACKEWLKKMVAKIMGGKEPECTCPVHAAM